MRFLSVLAFLAGFSFLAACTGEQRAAGGVSWNSGVNVAVTRIDDRTYDLNGAGPTGYSHDEVFKRMIGAAAKLTLEKGYDKFSVESASTKTRDTVSLRTGQVQSRQAMEEFRIEMFKASETSPHRTVYDAKSALAAIGG